MEDLDKPKVVMICGPTATGKSKLAVSLAKEFDGEVVGADSMQIYKGLVVGTATVTENEAEGVPHHLVGFLPPNQTFSVAEYSKQAENCIDMILASGKLPIVSGGTGLYLSALQEGTIFTPEKPNEQLRERLNIQWEELGAQAMLEKLAVVDQEYSASLAIADKKRILRGIEQWELTGKTRAQRDEESKGEPKYNFYCIGLAYQDRQVLYDKINHRVGKMIDAGILQEAEMVYSHKEEYKTAAQSIGYKEYFPYFMGEKSLEECTEKLKQATRRYAKRQFTWFRGMDYVHWMEVDDFESLQKQAVKKIKEFLES